MSGQCGLVICTGSEPSISEDEDQSDSFQSSDSLVGGQSPPESQRRSVRDSPVSFR
jgi:hypothetical protein